MAWDKTKPTTTSKIKDGPSIFQGNWVAIDDWTDVEHYGLSEASSGTHRLSQYKTIVFNIPGTAVAVANAAPSFIIPFSCKIVKAYGYSRTAPTGASLIFDIHKNGTTIWTTQGNRLTIAAGANTGTQTSFDVTALVEHDRLDLHVDQIGSTVAGADITIQLTVTQPD